MSSTALEAPAYAEDSWLARVTPARPLSLFRVTFAALWLAYDVLDIVFRGNATELCWRCTLDGEFPWRLPIIQTGLIVCELWLLLGYGVRAAALSAAVFRAAEAWLFPVNDFFYFIVTALLLAVAAPRGRLFSLPGKDERVPAWPRDLLLGQVAWIYFATAFLKLNPEWLSGGHLFVRHQFLAAIHGWPYPSFYRAVIGTLAGNAALAWMGVAGEFTLAALLVLRRWRALAILLAVAMHGYAALALNVWFFGASMIAQIALTTAGLPWAWRASTRGHPTAEVAAPA